MAGKKVANIINGSENIAKLRENYMNSIISRQEKGDRVGVETIATEANIAAQFEIAIQLAKLNENLSDFPGRIADIVSDNSRIG